MSTDFCMFFLNIYLMACEKNVSSIFEKSYISHRIIRNIIHLGSKFYVFYGIVEILTFYLRFLFLLRPKK